VRDGRSCRARLHWHNNKRRKRGSEDAAAAAAQAAQQADPGAGSSALTNASGRPQQQAVRPGHRCGALGFAEVSKIAGRKHKRIISFDVKMATQPALEGNLRQDQVARTGDGTSSNH